MPGSDDEPVLKAIRLGWCVAEVCGRSRPDSPGDPGATSDDAVRASGWSALHLRSERSATERRIEAQHVLVTLTSALGVDQVTTSPPTGLAQQIDECAKQLADWKTQGKSSEAIGAQWEELQRLLFHLDAHIQDQLSATSELQACGYQLGRGLAESYWASETVEVGSDSFCKPMLSPERCDELSRLAGRIGRMLPAYTACAIAGSLDIWKAVVREDDWWQQESTRTKIYDQQRRWFELLAAGQDPTTLIKPFAVLTSFRATRSAIKAFAGPIVGLAISLGLLALFVYSLSAGQQSAGGKALLGILGTVGLSLTTVLAKMKSASQALVTRLRQDAYADLVVLAITIVPTRRANTEGDSHPISDPTERAKTAAIRQRSLTTAVTVT